MNNIVSRIKAWFTRVTLGSNGADSLARCMLWVAIIIMLINLFVESGILSVLTTALLIYVCFRMFSKNVAQRALENARFEHATKKPREALSRMKRRWDNRSTTKYFTCKQCGQELSVPKGKGTLRATCPKCGAQTTVKS